MGYLKTKRSTRSSPTRTKCLTNIINNIDRYQLDTYINIYSISTKYKIIIMHQQFQQHQHDQQKPAGSATSNNIGQHQSTPTTISATSTEFSRTSRELCHHQIHNITKRELCQQISKYTS